MLKCGRTQTVSRGSSAFTPIVCAVLLCSSYAAACTASTVSPSVTICAPAAGASGPAPVHVTALTTDRAHPVTAMKVYLDYVAVYSVKAASLDTFIPANVGKHNLTINAWDSSGAVFKASETFTVTSVGSVTLSPASLDFGNQTVGTTSPGQTITVSNGAASAVGIASVAASGDFALVSNGCGTALPAHASCSIIVAFTPSATGTRNGTLTVTGVGTQTASLTGMGQAPVVSLSPASLGFGTQLLDTTSAAQTATLTNATASTLTITSVSVSGDFVIGGNNCGNTLAAGKSCNMSVSFHPTATGARNGTLTVTGSAGIQTSSLSGSGLAGASSCTAGGTDPSVTICTPGASTTNAIPVHLSASTTSSFPVTALSVMLDSATVFTTMLPFVDVYVGMTGGAHTITVQAKNSAGQTFQSAVSITAQAPAQDWPPCALSQVNQTVTLCNPPQHAIVSLPLHVSAGTTDTSDINQLQLSIDGAAPAYTAVNADTLDVYLTSLAPGPHTVTVTAINSSGAQYSSSAPVTVAGHSGLANLRHIVVLIQENHSFDNYFGLLQQYRTAKGYADPVDGLDLNLALLNAAGQAIQPYHLRTMCTEDLGKWWDPLHLDVNNGTMDLFLQETARFAGSSLDPNGNRAIGYYNSADLPYYYELASQFSTSDRFFASVLAPTVPNRMYLFAGTSFGNVNSVLAPAGGWTQPTIFDRLDAAGISWRYYVQDTVNFLNQWSTYQRDANKVFPITQYYTDVASNALPQMAFIERSGGLDEHPVNNIQRGAANTARLINALMNSPSWLSSAFILTYDEAGGYYDHVIPPPMIKPDRIAPRGISQPGDFGRTGQRVPLLVVSPWSRPHYVSHVWRDHTSILRLIEDTFGVPALTARDAAADNMIEMFDFTAPAFATPPPLPIQPTSGACNQGLEAQQGW
jgi:phospholipase C